MMGLLVLLAVLAAIGFAGFLAVTVLVKMTLTCGDVFPVRAEPGASTHAEPDQYCTLKLLIGEPSSKPVNTCALRTLTGTGIPTSTQCGVLTFAETQRFVLPTTPSVAKSERYWPFVVEAVVI